MDFGDRKLLSALVAIALVIAGLWAIGSQLYTPNPYTGPVCYAGCINFDPISISGFAMIVLGGVLAMYVYYLNAKEGGYGDDASGQVYADRQSAQ